MNLNDDDFCLFDVPARFEQDLAALDSRWKALQRETHPDRFASQGAAAQRIAMQWSVRVNEAYQRLKNPLKRAAYLCELNDAPVDAENNTSMPGDFLMQQMEWREALDEVGSPDALESLKQRVDAGRAAALSSLRDLIDQRADFQGASRQVRALMFIERFGKDIEAKSERWGQ